jgi:hypothetical protein
MYKAYKISEELAEELRNTNYSDASKFNSFQCVNGYWYISIEEVRDNVLVELPELELVDFEPIQHESIFNI